MGAGRVAASHFSIMVKELSQVFVPGPPVGIALGANVTEQELGAVKIGLTDVALGREPQVDLAEYGPKLQAFAQTR